MLKIFYALVIISSPFIGCSQTNYNELTTDEYNGITFNNVTLSSLLNFQGDINELSNLFGFSFTDITHPQNDEGKDYESTSISISYFENKLASIEVETSDITVNINGVDVHIGDNISSFVNGGVTGSRLNSFESQNDPNKGIIIFKPEYNSTYVSIYFNLQTGVIEKISFISPT
jgi:hypothetical protein